MKKENRHIGKLPELNYIQKILNMWFNYANRMPLESAPQGAMEVY